MAKYFIDETDPSTGKLYINYPMMESYRDCDTFFEDSYAFAKVSIEELSTYKNRVAKKKLSSIHVDKYTKEQVSSLILQNLYKLNIIHHEILGKPDYDTYLKCSDSECILSEEKNLIVNEKFLSVINTSLFMITDFYGNRNGFYDELK